MARTNKQGIAKKKAQQAKQKALSWWNKTKQEDGLKRDYTNPLWSSYTRFMRSGKRINDTTSCREDPDGYRIKRKPSWGEPTFEHVGKASRAYRRYVKKAHRMSLR